MGRFVRAVVPDSFGQSYASYGRTRAALKFARVMRGLPLAILRRLDRSLSCSTIDSLLGKTIRVTSPESAVDDVLAEVVDYHRLAPCNLPPVSCCGRCLTAIR